MSALLISFSSSVLYRKFYIISDHLVATIGKFYLEIHFITNPKDVVFVFSYR
jgi:hypothetical protein